MQIRKGTMRKWMLWVTLTMTNAAVRSQRSMMIAMRRRKKAAIAVCGALIAPIATTTVTATVRAAAESENVYGPRVHAAAAAAIVEIDETAAEMDETGETVAETDKTAAETDVASSVFAAEAAADTLAKAVWPIIWRQ